MIFLEQYRNGAHERVWDKLMQLGSAVREEPLHSDALAVAHETMRRVRQNIETLITRLSKRGFLFGYDHRLQAPLVSPDQESKYLAYLEMRFWVQKQPPVFLDATLAGQELMTISGEDVVVPNIPVVLEALEQEIGPVPLSLHAWYTEIGAVNFYGSFAPWDKLVRSTLESDLYKVSEEQPVSALMTYCDPLQVRALDDAFLADIKRQKATDGKSSFVFEFADDACFKDYYSGSQSNYDIRLPDARADALTYGMTFVQYLRLSLLHYAGFPGMAEWPVKPEEDLAELTKGLIPF